MRVFVSSKWIALAAALVIVGLSGRALAQRNDPNARNDLQRNESRPTADRAGAEGQKEGKIDQMVADQLLGMSTGEVQLANFVLQRTQNEAVRQFAQMMIQDHNKLNTELEKFANPDLVKSLGEAARQTGQPGQPGQLPQPGATTAAQAGATATAQPGATQPGATQPGATQPGARNPADLAGGGTSGGDNVKICEDIGKQIGALVTRELGQYQGSDFDRAYAGQQFWGHVNFIGVAKGAENHVSADLKQVLNQGATTAEQHLEHCRRLIRDLSTNVARGATETTPRR
jgi:predicted outer membrane protein